MTDPADNMIRPGEWTSVYAWHCEACVLATNGLENCSTNLVDLSEAFWLTLIGNMAPSYYPAPHT